ENSDFETQYSLIKIVRANKKKVKYYFNDCNVKFGESYVYYILSVRKDFAHSKKSIETLINIEDIEHPASPDRVIYRTSPFGNFFHITGKSREDIVAFDVFRKKSNEIKYDYLDRVKSDNGSAYFLDSFVSPGILYEYKFYSVDF